MKYDEIITQLKSLSNPENVEGMARFGINPKNTFGISIPNLRKLAKKITKKSSDCHNLAQELWESGYHEARILAGMIDEATKVTEKQMDSWITDFDSWDVCDQVCMNLFDKTTYALRKAKEWTKREKEFEKRAGFALMACLAWHDKTSSDKKFEEFFPYISRSVTDERNYVKKSVNWALRQIGKRNKTLKDKSINIAKDILNDFPDSRSAQWIAKDALRELKNKIYTNQH